MTDEAALDRWADLVEGLMDRLQEIAEGQDVDFTLHVVRVSRREVECEGSCPGPEPHLREFRAAGRQPTTEQTMAYRARDAVAVPDPPGGS